MMKYEKELHYIMNYYQNEEKRRKYMRNKAVGTISKNVQDLAKWDHNI